MHKSHLLLTKYASGHSYLVKKWQICTPLGPTQKKNENYTSQRHHAKHLMAFHKWTQLILYQTPTRAFIVYRK